MHKSEEVASHPAHVLGRDSEDRARSNGGVDCITPLAENPDAGLRRMVVNGANHRPAS